MTQHQLMYGEKMDNAPIRRIKDIADIYLGYPFRGAVKSAPDGDSWVVQPRDIDACYSIVWNAETMTKTTLTGRKEPNYLQAGDVLFLARGNNNHASAVTKKFSNAVCSPIFFQLRLKDQSLLPEFFAWQINQAPVQKQLTRTTEGTLQKNVSKVILQDIEIAIPSLETQQSIIKLASCFFEQIRTHQQLINNTKLSMTAIANDILSGD
ncbi:hypothetical protein MKHDV_00533 [Halodesulfovibrio sp. MK-HDV]|jgi:type I restriction modification DNA specificity protein|nr:hypothetical protein MKHDV_00533 [Halodesulfovibrio sp. MK-HDV]